MRGVPAAGAVSRSCLLPLGGAPAPTYPAGWRYSLGFKEVVRPTPISPIPCRVSPLAFGAFFTQPLHVNLPVLGIKPKLLSMAEGLCSTQPQLDLPRGSPTSLLPSFPTSSTPAFFQILKLSRLPTCSP